MAKGRGLHVGGNANNGANDGLAYVNANNGPANANTNIGSRLNWLIIARSAPPLDLASRQKIKLTKSRVSTR